jgi:ABC-2 type transport system permease protein
MNPDVFMLTLREFVGQRRSLLILLLALIPLALAAIYQLGDAEDPQDFTGNFLLDGVMITRILPLACLILGTAAIGSEIEDGTIVYLLAKPVSRRAIVFAKCAAVTLLSAGLLVPATALSGGVAIQGTPEDGIVLGFVVATAAGCIAYSVLFVMLSILTSRALLVGLGYVLVWEGLISDLFDATAYLSIRHYTLAIADMIASVDPDLLDAQIGGLVASALVAVVTVTCLWVAVERLETLELSEAE